MLKLTKLGITLSIMLSPSLLAACHHMTATASQQNEAILAAQMSETDLDTLSSWLVGSWDNIAQVEREIKDGIPVDERRQRYAMRYTEIETPDVEGRTFAIENYDDGTGLAGEMQRVSLHRFMLSEDRKNILHEILFLKDKAFRKSLVGNLAPLANITESDIRAREDCRLYWQWSGERFEGATRKGACVTNSYTDRDITVEGYGILEANRLMRHDRNFEMSGEEIKRPGYKEEDIFERVSD